MNADFVIPTRNGKPVSYLCGHSLGLQPVHARQFVDLELERWGALAVEGHFVGEDPWFSYHASLASSTGYLVGAKPEEVSVQNTLSVNIHLMLASFYRPAGKRTKILMESAAFPSDQYALETHIRFRGLVPEQELIEVQQDPNTFFVGTDKVLDLIAKHENELALVYLAGVQYLNGEVLEIERITSVCREKGIMIGWELAHAIGNVDLDLHTWSPDFAIWCNYKYGNGGPGTLGGLFVPSRHWGPETLRLAGWWGYKPETRFKMQKGFIPAIGADSWALSNPPILSLAPLKASLPMFEQAGWANLRAKSKALVQEVRNGLASLPDWEILTPNEAAAGNMLVIKHHSGKAYYNRLMEEGVIVDWREPGVIRFALCPLYNTQGDVDHLLSILQIK